VNESEAQKECTSEEGSECDNRICDANFYTVLYSNYGSLVLSFRDMTTKRTTDGPTSAINAYLTVNAGQQYAWRRKLTRTMIGSETWAAIILSPPSDP